VKRATAIVCFLAACSGGRVTASATETLKLAHGATNSARQAFIEWDGLHQADLVARATSAAEATAALAAYRAKRTKVVGSFAIAYSAIAAAAAVLPLVSAGKRSQASLVALVLAAADAARILAEEIAAFKKEGT
jgi:hypothetical protein